MSDIPVKSANGQQVVENGRRPSALPGETPPEQTASQASVALGVTSLEHLWFDDANALPELIDAESGAAGTESPGASGPAVETSAAQTAESWADDSGLEAITFAPVSRGDGEIESVSPKAGTSEVDEVDRPLVGLCEPLFNDICRLNQIKRLGAPGEMDEPEKIRRRLEKRLNRLSETARERGISGAFDTVAGPLRSFVDVVMTRGGFRFTDNWRPLTPRWAEPDRVLLGAAADALCDGDAVETGQLEVLQSCLSLTADLLPVTEGQPTGEDLLGAMGRRLIRPAGEHICPSAYNGLFASAILPPIARQLKVLVAISLSVLLLTIAIAVALNLRSARELNSTIDVVRHALDPAARPHSQSAP